MGDRKQAWLAAGALAAAVLAGSGGHARADGAIAVGTTGDVVRDGIAFGMIVNQPREKAAEIALGHCRSFRAPAAARRCKVVATFSGQCFAIAYDPKSGTPGAGWGIGPDQLVANDRALAMCDKTAGAARQGYCQVERGGCDVTGHGTAQIETSTQPAEQAGPPAPSGAGQPDTDSPPARTAGLDTLQGIPEEQPSPPEPAEEQHGGGAPVLPLAALVGVGAAYAVGQYGRGRLKDGIGAGQLRMGSALAIGAAVLVAALDMAGVQAVAGLVLAAAIAVAAAILA